MALIEEGIDNIRAFELPAGTWRDGEHVAAVRLAVVKWRSSWEDKLYRVYVNGIYAGSAVNSRQREMIVRTPSAATTVVRIEVFAVEFEHVYRDFSDELESSIVNSGRVKITLLRCQKFPPGSGVNIYFDNGTGQVDYNEPLTDSPIRIWPAWQDKAGFGMSRFAESDFGFDSSAAAGFGRGCFGLSMFGLDADSFEWVSQLLQAGVYKFGIKVIDVQGRQSAASETASVTVIPSAQPAEEIAVLSFDKQTNHLVLSVA